MSNFPSAFLNVDNNEEESAKNSVHTINNKTATYNLFRLRRKNENPLHHFLSSFLVDDTQALSKSTVLSVVISPNVR